jgi:hypothetical protein
MARPFGPGKKKNYRTWPLLPSNFACTSRRGTSAYNHPLQKVGFTMKHKHIATVALMLNFGVAGVYARQRPVRMMLSGTNVATTINLRPGTVTDEQHSAGNGSLGPFTFRELHADEPSPQPSSTCSGPYFLVVAGAGVFRFLDGSLLTVSITEGDGCVNLTAGVALLTVRYQITGGTGRFEGASGALTYTYTHKPVLLNASNAPALLALTGEIEGTVFRAAIDDEREDERQ